MRLVFLRHGLTNTNKMNLYNGQFDEDINEEGIEQAKKASEIISKMNFDKIYCSPLKRTKHTCEIVNTKNQEVIYDDRLKERTLGKFDGTDISKGEYNVKMHYIYSYDQHIEGVENIYSFFERVHQFLDEIIDKYSNDDTILIVTHGGVMRATYFYFEELPEDENVGCFQAKNCEINVYEVFK